MTDPIAIVGIGCRLPGGVTDAESYWRLLSERTDAIREIDRSGIELDRYFDETPQTAGRMMTRWGGFLDDLELFDARFFGISPREAATLDPAQRLLLETTWEACEDAGIDPRTLSGDPVGVFIGQWLSDFESRLFADTDSVDFHATTGSGRYASSGRLSFVLGATGPSISVDTACSSSLVAVHLACQSIRAGESTVAIAAGVNVILQPHISIAYSQSGMMAPDGHCKFGDANGDGYVRSEGAGVLVLKPLATALADGDPIRAVIRGSAVNNDGRGSGHLSTPSRAGQAAMLRTAYANAGVSPQLVGYVEAHGTGTRAGDPVEIGALGDVLAADRPIGSRCMIGSVKTNIGHTEGAAGLAGLIKCVLALEHREVPASLHLRVPNPAIAWDDLPFDIPQVATPWPVDTERVAGVSAFGITGTNAHVVVEAAPEPTATSASRTDALEGRAMPLALSAASPAALAALAASYAQMLDSPAGPTFRDVCGTAARHRAALEHRAVFVAAPDADIASRLRRFADGEQQAADAVGYVPVDTPRPVALAFPGQGGQWAGMARELLAAEPDFAAAIDRCDAALPPGTSWTVREQLSGAPAEPGGTSPSRLDEIAVIQPVLVAVEIALAELLRAWGVEPDVVVGHSMGEVAAAHVAGVLTLDDAMRIICIRSELLQRTSGAGAMALLDLGVDEARERIGPYAGRLVVAVSNGPRSTVVSGDPDAVAEVLAGCERDGIFGRAVQVDVASHSPQMDPLVPQLVDAVRDVGPRRADTRIYSSVDGDERPGPTWDAEYWGRNMRQPVMFGQTVERMLAGGVAAIVEVSPHPTLLPSIRQIVDTATDPPLAIGTLRRAEPEREAVLVALGQLWTAGCRVGWECLYPSGSYTRVRLPHYPWQRERHWSEAAQPHADDRGSRRRALDDEMRSWLHVTRWDVDPIPQPPAGASSSWVIVGGGDDAAALAAALESAGAVATVSESIEAAVRIAGEAIIAHDRVGIVTIVASDAIGYDVVTALQAVQAAWSPEAARAPRLWWVTSGAHMLGADAATDRTVAQAAVWGAARSVGVEHPDWWGGLVDADPAEALAAQVDVLAGHLAADDGEDQAAIRDGTRHVLRLVPAALDGLSTPYAWRHDAAYLITGGLGGVAEHIAAGMVRDGARRLVLLGRTGLPPRAEWSRAEPGSETARRISAVRALEHDGASVHIIVADITDEAQVRAALDGYAAEGWPPIVGVVHGAGVLESHLLNDLDRTAFDRVFLPKVAGAEVLDRVLPDVELFVVFSSMLALRPHDGMANYAAANTALDAFAALRRRRGQHGLSIQWGPWAATGLLETVGAENVENFRREGIGSMTGEQGAATFSALVASDESVVAVFPIDWAMFHRAHRGRELPMYRSAPGARDPDTLAAGDFAARLTGSSSAERRTLLQNLVRDTAAGVLRLPAAEIDIQRPFGSLGFDSLIALELRSQLETALERPLSATLAWNYPTVEQLAAHLDSVIGSASDVREQGVSTGSAPRAGVPAVASTQDSPSATHSDVDDLIADVAALSDDEALRALRGQ